MKSHQTTFILKALLLITAAGMVGACQLSTSSFRIGLAEISYNPPVGMDLVGNYRGNDYASRGVHDSLYARAIVFENGYDDKAAILAVDICKIPLETISLMRSYVAAHTDLKPGNIMIHATHTHSAPKAGLNDPFAREYMLRAASAVIEANRNLRAGHIWAGETEEHAISFNRRLACKDGKVHMSWERLDPDFVTGPLGPVDPEVIALWIEQEGKLTGMVVNFGCHPTTLTGNNWLYSADYPGFMADTLKKKEGNSFVPVFLNGCCGDVTQVNYKAGFKDTYDECRRIGYMLGGDALATRKGRVKSKGNRIRVLSEMVPVKRMTITEEQYAWAKQMMVKVEKDGMPGFQTDGIPDAQFAGQWIEMYEMQNLADTLEVMVVRVGDVAFVGLPGEMFNEFGSDIKKRSPVKHTLVMGLTNDSRKYFPTRVSFSQGPTGFTPMTNGYETTPGATLYDKGAGEKLCETAVSLLNRINE